MDWAAENRRRSPTTTQELRDEVWYLTLVEPSTGRALWLRWTLHLRPSGGSRASVWAFASEHGKIAFMGREDWPIEALRCRDTGELQLGPNLLLIDRSQGQLQRGSSSIRWTLDFGPPRTSWKHFSERLFNWRVASSCLSGPRLDFSISGSVEINGLRWNLESAPGEQSHLWGRGPTAHYAWAHCNAFEGAPGVVFEGLSAVVQRGALSLPPAGPILLSWPEGRFEVRGFLAMFRVRSEQRPGLWRFEAEDDNSQLLTGQVEVRPEACVSVAYERGPKLGPVYCQNSLVADCHLQLYKSQGARWARSRAFRARGTVAFEITRPEPNPAITQIFEHSDAEATKPLTPPCSQ